MPRVLSALAAALMHPRDFLCQQVFNDQQTFSEWFTRFLGTDTDGKPLPSAGGGGGGAEASAMDREKRILVVNRLHQILSPFMLRRMVGLLRCGLSQPNNQWHFAPICSVTSTPA